MKQKGRDPDKEFPAKSAGETPWDSIGPRNIAGRITSITSTPEYIFVGTAGGGVWRRKDGGRTWESLWDEAPLLSVGSLAIDPKDPRVIYCGTGEANLSGDSFPGIGVFRSENSGDTWKRIGSTEDDGLPPRIGTIAINPTDSKVIRIGGVRHNDEDACGMFISIDRGQNWQKDDFPKDLSGTNQYWCHSIVFDPNGVAFAAIDARGLKSGIWRKKATAKEWEQLTVGLPPGDQFGRTSLVVGPKTQGGDFHVIYALAGDRQSAVLGVFRSDDCGDTWTEIGDERFPEETQMSYNNCIAVHPSDPDYVIWGGMNLHRTTDGGETWKNVTKSDLSSREQMDPRYAHADHHALFIVKDEGYQSTALAQVIASKVQNVPAEISGKAMAELAGMVHGTSENYAPIFVYDGNDGGFFVGEDRGTNWNLAFPSLDRGIWENCSRGLVTTMFYDVDVAPSESSGLFIAGGTQDNGVLARETGNKKDDFSTLAGGDGGWTAYDPEDASHLYTSVEHMYLYRREQLDVLPEPSRIALRPDEREAVWMSVLAIDPTDTDIVFAASTRVWRTVNDGKSWEPVSDFLDGSVVSAIEIADANHNRIYVGTENGGFFRSLDGGDNWSQNLAGPVLPGRIITHIESHPEDENCVFVTVGCTDPALRYQEPTAQQDLFSHVFRSTDGGRTWEDADQKQLPKVPHLALAFETCDRYRLFVAAGVEIWMSQDPHSSAGIQWLDVTGNLPAVMVTDLVYHKRSRTLTAATYGRGLWRADPDQLQEDALKKAEAQKEAQAPEKTKQRPRAKKRK